MRNILQKDSRLTADNSRYAVSSLKALHPNLLRRLRIAANVVRNIFGGKMENQYLEWCEIMKQKPNSRDEIIFNAGREFYLLSKNTSHNSDYAKCKCNSTKTYTDVAIICDECGNVQK